MYMYPVIWISGYKIGQAAQYVDLVIFFKQAQNDAKIAEMAVFRA